ncbi:MAG: AMP-binding protein, partial [Candidatus Syntrophosphaera sp.]
MQTAKKHARQTAVHDKATDKVYTYGKLLIASLILKDHIAKIRGKYVGILLPTSTGCMLGILGTLMNGKIPVMINYSTGAIENCLYAREKCAFKTILTSRKLLEKLELEPIDHM